MAQSITRRVSLTMGSLVVGGVNQSGSYDNVEILDDTADPSTTTTYNISLTQARLKMLGIYSSQDVSIAMGGSTLTLQGGSTLNWKDGDNEACPIGGDVTTVAVTVGGATASVIKGIFGSNAV